jgi:hypothetical protein
VGFLQAKLRPNHLVRLTFESFGGSKIASQTQRHIPTTKHNKTKQDKNALTTTITDHAKPC